MMALYAEANPAALEWGCGVGSRTGRCSAYSEWESGAIATKKVQN